MTTLISMNERGSLTLPAKIRKSAGLKSRDLLLAEVTAEGILLRPTVTLPVEIYTEERIREFDEQEEELVRVLKQTGVLKS